uniref:Uncharacterized protein n=1 Tax=Arundo donax TaxID=35708 RepID=A0A0A9D995_ARUDO
MSKTRTMEITIMCFLSDYVFYDFQIVV